MACYSVSSERSLCSLPSASLIFCFRTEDSLRREAASDAAGCFFCYSLLLSIPEAAGHSEGDLSAVRHRAKVPAVLSETQHVYDRNYQKALLTDELVANTSVTDACAIFYSAHTSGTVPAKAEGLPECPVWIGRAAGTWHADPSCDISEGVRHMHLRLTTADRLRHGTRANCIEGGGCLICGTSKQEKDASTYHCVGEGRKRMPRQDAAGFWNHTAMPVCAGQRPSDERLEQLRLPLLLHRTNASAWACCLCPEPWLMAPGRRSVPVRVPSAPVRMPRTAGLGPLTWPSLPSRYQMALVSRSHRAERLPGEDPDPPQLDGSFSGGTGLCLRMLLLQRFGRPPRSAEAAASDGDRCRRGSPPGDATRAANACFGRPSELAFAAEPGPGIPCRQQGHMWQLRRMCSAVDLHFRSFVPQC